MSDDLDIYRISQPRKTSEITILPPYMAIKGKQRRKKEQEEDKKRNNFKNNFLRHFKLDEDRFSINLIKKDGEWFVEILNNKTGKKIYQSYSVVCNILDINCKLPKIVGVNVDKLV